MKVFNTVLTLAAHVARISHDVNGCTLMLHKTWIWEVWRIYQEVHPKVFKTIFFKLNTRTEAGFCVTI